MADAHQILAGTGSAFGIFDNMYSRMSAPVGSSDGGGVDTVTMPVTAAVGTVPAAVEPERHQSVPEYVSESEFEIDDEPEHEAEAEIHREINKGKQKAVQTEVQKTPRPQREKKKGSSITDPFTAGAKWFFRVRTGKGKKKSKVVNEVRRRYNKFQLPPMRLSCFPMHEIDRVWWGILLGEDDHGCLIESVS